MAEALGVISSTITIWDLACKLRKCYKRIQAAPAVWKEYCGKLESLSHVHSVLEDMISDQPHPLNEVKSGELANLAAKEVRIIKEQANHILGVYETLAKSPRNRIWEWLRVKRTSIKFVVAEEHLQGLIDSAERAKMSLQSAVCLCGLETLNAGQTKMQDAFQLLHYSMKEQAKALERLNRDMNRKEIGFDLIDRRGRLVKVSERNGTSTEAPGSESRHSSRRSNKGRDSARQGHRRKRGSAKAKGRGDHNAQGAGAYEVVLHDNKVLIMATDKILATNDDEYKSTIRGGGTDAHTAGLYRVERALENKSRDEWEQGIGNQLYEFQRSPASNSATSINADLNNDTIPIIIGADKQSRAFVGETTNLDQCVYHETDSMSFCVAYICVTETDQTFNIKEPCDQPCRHIELRIMNKWLGKKKLPCMVDFQSITCGVAAGVMAEIDPLSSFTLKCYYECPHRKPCAHTILEDGVSVQDGRTRQVIVEDSERLQAWLNSSEQDLDTPAESSEESDTPTGGPGSTEDDNDPAIALFDMVHRQDNNVPARIPFEMLVGYLKLIERLQPDFVHLVQCHIWTDALISDVSSPFEGNMIAWAWVFWKLRRDGEFKIFTAIMQKEGKHMIGGETNQYGVILPQQVIRAIDWKRISVLSQIRDLVQNSIEISRRSYMIARREEDPGRAAPPKIMSSSLMAGYLTLEYEMFLLDGRTWDDGNFDGVSFVDASGWIRSMINLEDWMAKLISPPSTMLSGLQALFSGVDAGFHEARISSGLPSNVYEDLNGLIKRLAEEDDWGVDLPNE